MDVYDKYGRLQIFYAQGSLDDILDVTITSAADNEVLAYDSASSLWINQTPDEANIIDKATVQTISGLKTFQPIVTSADAIIAKAYTVMGSTTFTGSGLDDLTYSGTYVGASSVTYRAEIDATGTPDTFKWSKDGGATFEATGVAITGAVQTLDNGVVVTYGVTTGHTVGDYWDIPVTAFTGTLLEVQNAAGVAVFTAKGNVPGNAIIPSSLVQATGDEISWLHDMTVNKATSGDAYGVRILITDTLSPGSIYPFSISDNSIVSKDGYVGIGMTPTMQLEVNKSIGLTGVNSTDNILFLLTRGTSNNSLFGLPGADDNWIAGSLQGDFIIRSDKNTLARILLGNADGAGWFIDKDLNVANEVATDFGGGAKVMRIGNATTNPSTNPTAGFLMYSSGGVASFRSAAGNVVQLGGTDYLTVPSYPRHIDIEIGMASSGSTAPTDAYVGTTAVKVFNADGEQSYIALEIPDDWVGDDMSFRAIWAPLTAMADTETVKLDITFRSIATGEALDNGTAAIATMTYTQSGAGTANERIDSTITIPFDDANQPLAKGDKLFIIFNRDMTTDTFAGDVGVAEWDVILNSNTLPKN